MATLTNTKIKDTYDGLLKTTDNEALDASGVTLIEDGLGNASALSVGRSGNGVTITGNLAVDTNTLYVDSASNEVGIGTSSPSRPLHITADTPAIRLEDSTGSDYSELVSVNGDLYIRADEGNTEANSTIRFQIDQSEKVRIDASGNVGIGTASPSERLEVNGNIELSTSENTIQWQSGNGIIQAPSNLYIRTSGAGGNLLFQVNNNEKMRIDSSGHLALGTTNANPFGINNSNTILSAEAGAGFSGNLQIGTSGVAGDTNDYLGFLSFYSKNGGSGVEAYSRIISQLDGAINSTNLQFQTESGGVVAERMRIDSSGNVGIGITPSVQFHLGGSDSNKIYADRGSSTRFQMFQSNDGQTHLGSSGSNAALILRTGTTFGTDTERMRITSAGNVGIGEPNPAAKIHINSGTENIVAVFESTDTETEVQFIDTTGTAKIKTRNDFRFEAGGSERMRIDSSGNVGLANSNPITRLDIDGFITLRNAPYPSPTSGVLKDGFIGSDDGTLKFTINGASNAAYGSMAFITRKGDSTDPIEAMRITSGGDVLIGKTSSDVTTNGVELDPDGVIRSTATDGSVMDLNRKGTDGNVVLIKNDNSIVGSISVSGSSTAYNTSSDYRLKENVVEMTGALDRVDALKPSRFNFIADPEKTVDGFLAHEVAEVVPEAVTGEKDAVEEYEVTPAVLDEDGNVIEEAVIGTRPVYQGIDQSKIVPLLVGAIKELRAEIELLKSQING